MQGQRTVKRQKLVKQIRRNQINSFMAECRSKMLLTWSPGAQKERSSVLNTIMPQSYTGMERIKRFMEALIRKDAESMKEEANVSIDFDKVNSLLTLPKGSKFCIKPTNQQCWLEQSQLCKCLKLVSREICTSTDSLNKDLHKLNKITMINEGNQLLIQQLLGKIYQMTADLKLISEYYNILLQACAQLLSNMQPSPLNQSIVEQITSCLIELSCFRPRKYANPMNLPFVDEINKIMKDYRESFSIPTNKQLIILANQYFYNSPNLKIIINIIYIFGNIFVSMTASEYSAKEHFAQIHEFVFAIFKHALRLQGQSMPNAKGDKLLTIGKEQIEELASLMVWFIRNQILIVEGMFESQEGMKTQNSGHQPKQIDNNWIDLSFFLLQKMTQPLRDTSSQLTELQVTTISDILSLIKLLLNDFNLTSNYVWDAFKLIYPLCLKLREDKSHYKLLQSKIYQFFIDFMNYKFTECKEFCLSKELTQTNPHSLIYEQATLIIHRQELTGAGLRLCTKVINPQQCIKDPHRMRIYQQICTGFEGVLKRVQSLGQYEVTRQFIDMAHAVFRIFEVTFHSTSMQVEFLSLDILVHLLKVCQIIWHSEKSVRDIIASLQLLRTMADIDHISSFLKEAIIKEGYREQLENLSAHPNQDINRLVYEVYELLDLQ